MGTAFQHASFRHIEGCHLPIKSIGWLSTTRLIEYMYIKAEKDTVGLKPYHAGNNASLDLNRVAKYYLIKIGVIKPYDNLRL